MGVESRGSALQAHTPPVLFRPAGTGLLLLIQAGARHWLALANVAVGAFVAGSFAAPALMALGLSDAALALYTLYGLMCHQWPFRTFFLFGPRATYGTDALSPLVGTTGVYDFIGSPMLGYKMGFCERDLAIYAAILMAGIAYAFVRGRARPASLLVFLLLAMPMALDGFTQLFGWRESTWELRLLTGTLFGAATVWFIYPRFERVLAEAGLAPSSTMIPDRAT